MRSPIVLVRSEWRSDVAYAVNVRNRTCTCALFRSRRIDCKHILAVCGRHAGLRREGR